MKQTRLIPIVLVFLFCGFPATSFAKRFNVSLVTMYPGDKVFTSFGHVAIRIKDRIAGSDMAYDYGVYDSTDPLLGYKFFRGTLKYYCSQKPFAKMFAWYSRDFGGMVEYGLNMTDREILGIQRQIMNDLSTDRGDYQYHHFHNNCSTKIRDIIDNALGGTLGTTKDTQVERTYRDLIDASMGSPALSLARWIVFGLLNGETDQKLSKWEQMFLPWYLADEVKDIQHNGQPLVEYDRVLAGDRAGPPELPEFWPSLLLLFVTFLLFWWPVIVPRQRKLYSMELFAIAGGLLPTYGMIMIAGMFISPYPELQHNVLILVFSPLLYYLVPVGKSLWKQKTKGLLLLKCKLAILGLLLVLDLTESFDHKIWPYLLFAIILYSGVLLSLVRYRSVEGVK